MRTNERKRLRVWAGGWLGPVGVLVWPPVALAVIAAVLSLAACAPARAEPPDRVCGRIDLRTGAMETYPCPPSIARRVPMPSPPRPQDEIIIDNSPEAIERENRERGSVTVPLQAHRACHPDASELARQLEGPKWGERKTANGLQRNGLILQIFTSGTTGTWTAVTVDPVGRGCIVANGDRWRAVRLQKLGPDDISAEPATMRGGGLPAGAVGSSSPGLPDAAPAPGSTPGPRNHAAGEHP